MKTTRCKFICTEIRRYQFNDAVVLKAEYDPSVNNEDHQFMRATPNGTLEMTLSKDGANFFTLGNRYYLDISEVVEL